MEFTAVPFQFSVYQPRQIDRELGNLMQSGTHLKLCHLHQSVKLK